MKWLGLVTAVIALASCTTLRGRVADNVYFSPLGDFSCHIPGFPPAKTSDAFGPYGGTIRFTEEFWFTRVDVEEFNPKIPSEMKNAKARRRVYEGYLQSNLLSLVKQSVPDASVVSQSHIEIDGKAVFASISLLPKASNTVASGERLDGYRGAIQYSDGNFMYVVSILDPDRPRLAREKHYEHVLARATSAFRLCAFPQ